MGLNIKTAARQLILLGRVEREVKELVERKGLWVGVGSGGG